MWDWYWLLGLAGGVRQQCEIRDERYCVVLVLVIVGRRWVIQQGEGRAERYCVGLVLFIGSSKWGERAVRGRERNGLVWDWY